MRKSKFFVLTMVIAMVFSLFPLQASNAQMEDNTLIKGSGPGVYWYVGGNRYVFPSEKVYKSWFDNFDNIVQISDEALGEITIGGNVTYRPGVRMIKIQTDPKVYAVGRGGVLYWVANEEVAKGLYGGDWNKMIDDLADAYFVNYEMGSAIENLAQVDLGKQRDETPTPSFNLRRYAVTTLPEPPEIDYQTGPVIVGGQPDGKFAEITVEPYRGSIQKKFVDVRFKESVTEVVGRLFDNETDRIEDEFIPLTSDPELRHFELILGGDLPAGDYTLAITAKKASGEYYTDGELVTIEYPDFYMDDVQITQVAEGDWEIFVKFNHPANILSVEAFRGQSKFSLFGNFAQMIPVSDDSQIIQLKGLSPNMDVRFRVNAMRADVGPMGDSVPYTYEGIFNTGPAYVAPEELEPEPSPQKLEVMSLSDSEVTTVGIGSPWNSRKVMVKYNMAPKKVTLKLYRSTPESFVNTFILNVAEGKTEFSKEFSGLWQNMNYNYQFIAEDDDGSEVIDLGVFKTTTAQPLRSFNGSLSIGSDKQIYTTADQIIINSNVQTTAFEEWHIQDFLVYEEGAYAPYGCSKSFHCTVRPLMKETTLPYERRFRAVLYDDQSNRLESDWISVVVNPDFEPEYRITNVEIGKPLRADGTYIESMRDLYIDFNRPSKDIRLQIVETQTGVVHTDYMRPDYLVGPDGITTAAMGGQSSFKPNTKYTFTIESVDNANPLNTAKYVGYFETGEF
jgi:hypothetical protein